jgi:hypothetical protein
MDHDLTRGRALRPRPHWRDRQHRSLTNQKHLLQNRRPAAERPGSASRKLFGTDNRSGLAYLITGNQIFSFGLIAEVDGPRHLARIVLDLSNAFTGAFKELDPIPQFKATAKLGPFLEEKQSLSSSHAGPDVSASSRICS